MLIKNGTLILPDRLLRADLRICGGIIAEIGKDLTDSTIIDASGLYIAPGLVDIHTHGGGGADFMDADTDAFDTALRFHAKNGTTSLLPTTLTAPKAPILQMVSHARERMNRAPEDRARVLGVHAEGPYLSVKNKGAQPEAHLMIPARDGYDWLIENRDVIKTVTLSPELDGAAEMCAALTAAGILPCGGHDAGSKPEILPAIAAGLRHCTHLWCAMSTVAMIDGTRYAGLCEIGLTRDDMTAEIIGDGYHMPPELVQIAYRCKGADRLCIVSDCLRAGGMPDDGRLWALGSDGLQQFVVDGGVGRLPDRTRLAGSIQPLSRMVKNFVDDCKIPLTDAVRMASLTPASIIGKADKVGSIAVGKCADLCIFTPTLTVHKVMLDGTFI
ncbi:MAG: N-acetylglucosamine-6-phosphate deacetylase [Ruminococcaceae bacterium]|nr:N-acetylglucosamine-6-phosphate deacetylase [Oscillospiraceae bacterium]